MDISQILGSGAARPDSGRAAAAQTPSGGDFGNALVRARGAAQPDAGNLAQAATSQATRKDAVDSKPSTAPAGKNAGKSEQPASADRADGKQDASAQAGAKPADGAAEAASAVADSGSDPTAPEDESTTADAGSAEAALLAALFGLPATPAQAAGAAVATADGAAGANTASTLAAGAAGAAAAGTTPVADPAALAADTLQTIASQRAALTAPAPEAATGAKPDADAALADLQGLPQHDTAADGATRATDSGKPAATFDTLLKNAVAADTATSGQTAGGQADGQAARQDAQPLRAAAPATPTPAPSANAALQAAIAASQPAEAPAGSADARTDAVSVLNAAVATDTGTQDTQAVRHGVLSPRVGASDWPQALSQQMVRFTTQGNHTAELQLNPPDLGPLKIVLNVADDQAQAQFVSSHASVRAAIEAALPQLRNALADSGIQLGQTSVGAEQHFAGQAGQGQQQNGQRGSAPAWNSLAGNDSVADVPATPAATSRVPQGEVDTFA